MRLLKLLVVGIELSNQQLELFEGFEEGDVFLSEVLTVALHYHFLQLLWQVVCLNHHAASHHFV